MKKRVIKRCLSCPKFFRTHCTATNENVLYANAILNDALQKEGKKGARRVGKYMQKFPNKFTGTDEADDFINEPKFDYTEVQCEQQEAQVDESELFEGLL